MDFLLFCFGWALGFLFGWVAFGKHQQELKDDWEKYDINEE